MNDHERKAALEAAAALAAGRGIRSDNAPPRLEVRKWESHANKKWYFDVRSAGNHEVIAQSQGYEREESADKAINLLRNGMTFASPTQTITDPNA